MQFTHTFLYKHVILVHTLVQSPKMKQPISELDFVRRFPFCFGFPSFLEMFMFLSDQR